MNTWLNAKLAAERAGRSVSTIRKALERGDLHGHQTCRAGNWSIKREAVDAWLMGIDGPTACGCVQLPGAPSRRARRPMS